MESGEEATGRKPHQQYPEEGQQVEHPSQRLIRNSERATYRRCRQKWHWSYVMGLEPIQRKGALSFGTGVHRALELRYPVGRIRGPLPQDTWIAWFDEREEYFDQWDEEGNKIPARDLGAIMLEEYVKLYGKDYTIEIIQPEMAFQVDVFDAKGNYLCTWVGKGDAVYIDLSKSTSRNPIIGMLEHKTAKTIDEMTTVISGYGEQAASYFWGASYAMRHQGYLPEGAQIDHVLFNWLRKGVPSDKPRNAAGHVLNKPSKDALLDACLVRNLSIPKRPTNDQLASLLRSVGVDPDQFGEVSKVQPSPLFHRDKLDFGPSELAGMNWRIRAEAWEMAQVRAGNLPLFKNPTKDCKWDCPFKDACEVHEMGGDYQSILQMEFTTWNPYSDHELEEEKH
jgi:hypothetical protein